MSSSKPDSNRVIPGDSLGSSHEYMGGNGTYVCGDVVRSSIVGDVLKDVDEEGRMSINVVSKFDKAEEAVLSSTDKVLCRVLRTNYNQAFVDILSVADRLLPIPCKGVIRREDISSTEIDKVVVQEHFKGGDIVRATVISLGDSRQYYLGTSEPGLGIEIPSVRRSATCN